MKALDILKNLKIEEHKKKFPSMPEYAIPKPKYSDATANGLTKCIIDFVNMKGYLAERTNTMGRVIDGRKTYTDAIGQIKTIGSMKYIPSTGMVGSSDIKVYINGKIIAVEVKMKDKQSDAQKQYQLRIEQAGGQYWIVRNFEEFYNNYINLI
jgi:hypothetical protein